MQERGSEAGNRAFVANRAFFGLWPSCDEMEIFNAQHSIEQLQGVNSGRNFPLFSLCGACY